MAYPGRNFSFSIPNSTFQIPNYLIHLLLAAFLFSDRIGFVDAARLAEGLGLVAATLHVFRRRPALAVWLPAALCAGAVVAAAMTVLITRGVGPAPLLYAYRRLGRSAFIFDVN